MDHEPHETEPDQAAPSSRPAAEPETCAECGFTEDPADGPRAPDRIMAEAGHLADLVLVVSSPARRREPATWSPLEYACHVRDVLLVQRERVLLARREDTPVPSVMGRDVRVDHDGYADQAPGDVSRQLRDAAGMFANTLGRLGDDWARTIRYNWPQPRVRDLRWVAVHTLHEVVHHRLDIARQA